MTVAPTSTPLAPLTTLGVGGPARWVAEPDSVDALCDALAWADQAGLPVICLGGGSNVLVADTGYDGLVLRPRLRGLHVTTDGVVQAAAGEPWEALVDACVSAGLQGVECMTGIPGWVGAAPIQNIGACGQELADVVVSVDTVRLADRQPVRFDRDTCGFGYTWPAFVSDAEWVKLRWRPWQPATLGGEKHVQAILWALAGALPDLRKRSCNLAIDAMNKVRAQNPEWIMPLLTVQRQGNGFAWVFGRNAASERKIEGGSKIYFDGNQFGPGSNADSFSSVKKLVDFMSKNAGVVNAILKERALFEQALGEADDDLSEQMVKKIHRQLMQGVEEFLIRERLRTEKLGTADTLLPIIEGLHASCAQQV